jgi:chitin disaccharide deacetylase
MKNKILCADDYAMSDVISDGIYDLASQYRLDAISCMSDSPLWKEHQKRLKNLPHTIDIGLHLNLTHPFKPKQPSLNSWIIKSLSHSINKREVYRKFDEQWDKFCQIHGKQPDFIDGHQHIHVFPQIRDQLLKLLENKNADRESIYIRDVSKHIPPFRAHLKRTLLKLLSFRFNKTMSGYQTNTYFGGIYDFATSEDYNQLLDKWLTMAPDKSIIMCHPARAYGDETYQALAFDLIAEARRQEYASIHQRNPL